MEKFSKIRVRSIAIASIMILVSAASVFAKTHAPDLAEVLKKQSPQTDWSFLVFGFFALSLSTLSLAKAYEVFKKSQCKKEEPKMEFDNSEIDLLKSEAAELKSVISRKNVETETLRAQIYSLEKSVQERINGEDLLKQMTLELKKPLEVPILSDAPTATKNETDLKQKKTSSKDHKKKILSRKKPGASRASSKKRRK
ncbi:hypothetical protein HZC34_00950 [Candidatus Saganbacteria bacterium]|nr:hypothetical protein [Candidatus Saganbacteria bacterium]